MRRLFTGAAACLVLAACADSPGTAPTDVASAAKIPTTRPAACPTGTTGAEGTLPGSDALFLICVPPGFDAATGSLVVYSPGYVPPQFPLAIRDDELGGTPVSSIVTGLGFAFATTSYRANGLVVVDATHDVQRLVAQFRELYGPVGGKVFGVGASEGGLITVLAAERQPQLFDGALALCPPVGSFERQLDYFNDFRTLFDAFFNQPGQPPIIPGSVVAVPLEVTATFATEFQAFTASGGTIIGPFIGQLLTALQANPVVTGQFLTAAGLGYLLQQPPATIGFTVIRLLSYNLLGSADAQQFLGGQPYDNSATDYGAPGPDALDLLVARFTADQPAISHIRAKFETTGRLKVPVVTLFNTEDPVVPFFHQALFQAKVDAAGAADLLTQRTSAVAFGHCVFAPGEAESAFGLLVSEVGSTAVAAVR
jgi:pimeloyl-ACP methyl ester carboxylesterase